MTSADGLREVKTETLEVQEAEKPPPLAPYFTFLPAAPQPGDTVRFVGWASGQGVTLSWWLNGQEVGRGAEVERTFEQEGRFEVTLVATDGAGRSEQTNRSLAVVERPLQVAFSAPSQVRSGQEVQFANQTQPLDRVVGWRWEFGDGATSGDRSPLHRFVNEGEAERSFQVVLWATNRAGKPFASMPQTITVLPAQKPVPAPQAAVGWLVLLAGAAAAAGWWVLRKRPLTYPVELTLVETSPAAAAGGAAANKSCQSAKTFLLERAGEKVDLGQGPDQRHLYDLNAPNWFIMAKDGMLELCNRSGGSSKLQSGQTVPVRDAGNQDRQLRLTFKSVARPKPGGTQTRTPSKRGP